jgi:hypothetical protein
VIARSDLDRASLTSADGNACDSSHDRPAPWRVSLPWQQNGSNSWKILEKLQDSWKPVTTGEQNLIHYPAKLHGGNECPVRDREVASSNPVAPTILRNEPFGEHVEGLFHCEDAGYRSTSVFKWHCTMVELTRRSDGTPLFAWRNVVQIPSPVLAVAPP